MMRRLIPILLVIMLATPLLQIHHSVSAEPHAETLYTCIFPDGPFAGQEILVRYDAPNAELSLVSNTTGETVQVLENGLHTPQFEARGWSSDCRYMIASLGIWGQQQTAAWDVVENRRVGTIETQGQRYADLIWEPASHNRLVIESLGGAYFWYLPSNTQTLLTNSSTENGRNFETVTSPFENWYQPRLAQITWDTNRGQFYGVKVGTEDYGVSVYDIVTGETRAFYALQDATRGPVDYKFIDKGNYLLVYSSPESHGEFGQFRIWNLNTGDVLPQLKANIWRNWKRPFFFSDSHRYLVTLNNEMLVWDLQMLTGEAPFEPTYSFERPFYQWDRYVDGLRFAQNETIIQAVTFWYGLDFTIWQWDMATGERFYATKYLETVCDDLSQLTPEDDVELVTWACSYR